MKSKIVAIIPIKSKSKRVKGKNFRKIGNKKLYQFLLETLRHCKFDEIYVDSDSNEIKNYCKKNNFNFLKRKPHLAKDDANGNDLLNYHSEIIKADYYFQLFITAPLLKAKTINDCIKIIKENKKIDSIFTCKSIYSWFWFRNKPINYIPKILPRSQDAKPVIVESTGLYGIKAKTLKKIKCRIGKKPYFYEIDDYESLDIDNKKDIEYLKYQVSNKK